jgi:hypothetical protein
MTKNQKTKLLTQMGVFIMAFSMIMVCIPYVAVILAIYCAIQLARKV